MFAAHPGYIFLARKFSSHLSHMREGWCIAPGFQGIVALLYSGTLTATGGIRLEKRLGGTPIIERADGCGLRSTGTSTAAARGNVSGVEEATAGRRRNGAEPGVLDG